MRTLVLGMGNPILRDDAVGLRVADALMDRTVEADISILTTSLSGHALMDLFEDFERAIIVDSIQTGGRPGDIYCVAPQDFVTRQSSPFLHNLDFFQALHLGRQYFPVFPEEIVIVAIETEEVTTYGEGLTPEVEKAVPSAVEAVLTLLKEHGGFMEKRERESK